jgi:GTPase SAR1 family protein
LIVQDDSWLERDVTGYLLVFSIDSKSSFRHVLELIDLIRRGERTRHKPIIVAGNKIDLERKRAVSTDGK